MQMIDLNDPLENDIFFLQSREKNKRNLIKLILITLHDNENNFFNFLEYVLCITAAVCCYCLQFYKSRITLHWFLLKEQGSSEKPLYFIYDCLPNCITLLQSQLPVCALKVWLYKLVHWAGYEREIKRVKERRR